MPVFINNLKVKQPMCDKHGNVIPAIEVDSIYEVQHTEEPLLDDEGNLVMVFKNVKINDYEIRVLSDSFYDFFEEVDGEEV